MKERKFCLFNNLLSQNCRYHTFIPYRECC